MRFISPKVDYALKKIFGSEQSQRILISFLNVLMLKKKVKNEVSKKDELKRRSP